LVVVEVVEVRRMDLVTHQQVQILELAPLVEMVVVEVADFKQTVRKHLLHLQTLAVVAVAVVGKLIQ
jgi:hypothetical protein